MRNRWKHTMRPALLVCTALSGAVAPAADTHWPLRPVRIVHGSPPAGTADIIARITSDFLRERLGQPLVVDARPGASATLAQGIVAKAQPDGYTFMLTSGTPHITAPMVLKGVPYDALRDFRGVALMVTMPNALYVNKDFPVRTVKELIAYAKANPGKLNYSSSGSGSSAHLSGVLFAQIAGVDLVHVPYKGSAFSVLGVVAGEVKMAFDNLPTVMPQIRAGNVRALLITSAKRSPELPDVPVAAESGVKGLDISAWFGMVALTRTPAPIVTRFADEIGRSLADPVVSGRLQQQGMEPAMLDPAAFDAFIKADVPRWAEAVKRAGLKAE